MIYTDACIYFVISILGLAYPISLQVVTRLDEKYGSVNILDRFNREWNGKLFNLSLYVTLGFCLFYFIWKATRTTPCPTGQTCYYWYDGIFLALTTSLVLSFLCFTYKIFIYYSPFRLTRYFIDQNETNEHDYFRCLADIYFLSIRVQDSTLISTIHAHFYERFRKIRTDAGAAEVIYPHAYYEMVHDALIEASENSSRKTLNTGLNIASGRYFFGEHTYTNISQATYDWNWHNLKFIIETSNDAFAFEYWHNADQFMASAVPPIRFKTNREDPIEILNKKEIDFREAEREKFYECHIALGGMILYGQRYNLVDRIFRHTMSIPPRYELLPSTMTTVFGLFTRFASSVNQIIPYRYHFFGSEGIAGERLSHHWICKYIALLLLRQYTVTSYYYGQDPVALPYLPSKRSDKKVWVDCMAYLKSCLRDVRDQKKLMDITGIAQVTDSWCAERRILAPEKLIDEVVNRLTTSLAAQEVEQPLSEDKVNQFFQKSATIISEHAKKISQISHTLPEEQEYTSANIAGTVSIIKKEAFADDQGTSYIDFDTQVASRVTSKMTAGLTQAFKGMIVHSYVFNEADLFKAIDILENNKTEYVLLNFGIYLPFLIEKKQIEGLSQNAYNGIQILDVPAFDRRIMDYCLLLIEKSKLPSIIFNELAEAEVANYALKKIEGETNLYANVIDLNKEPRYKAEFRQVSDETLDISILAKLAFDMEIRSAKDARAIELKLHSEFRQNGMPNKLEDVGK